MERWGCCASCAEGIRAGDSFCSVCGAPVTPASRTRVCARCGSGYSDGYVYCVEDGSLLAADGAAVRAIQTPLKRQAASGPTGAPASLSSRQMRADGLGATRAVAQTVLRALGRFFITYERLLLTSLAAAGLASILTLVFVGPLKDHALIFAAALSPALIGLAVGLLRSDGLSGTIQDIANWASRHHKQSAEQSGFFHRWVAAPLLRAPEAGRALAGRRADQHVVSGIAVIVQLYALLLFAALTYVVVMVVIFIVLTIAVIWFGFWILGNVLSNNDEKTAERGASDSLQPKAARGKRNFFGDEYEVHKDGKGRIIGETREKTDWRGRKYVETRVDGQVVAETRDREDFLGRPFVETRNTDGKVVEQTRQREGFFAREYREHRDGKGDKTGTTREKEGFFGDRYEERRDADGTVESTTRQKKNFFGPYTEHASEDE